MKINNEFERKTQGSLRLTDELGVYKKELLGSNCVLYTKTDWIAFPKSRLYLICKIGYMFIYFKIIHLLVSYFDLSVSTLNP